MFRLNEGDEISPNLTETGAPPPSTDAPVPPVPVTAPSPVARVVAPRICRITFAGLLASEQARVEVNAWRLEVHAWIDRLGELTSTLTAGHVIIEAVDRGNKGRDYRVRMDLTLPTGVVAVEHDHPNNRPHEDVYVAIRNAFRAARRQLESHRLTPGSQP